MRIVFLQYPSDAIVFFDPLSTFRAPVWMREPQGGGVPPDLRFLSVMNLLGLCLEKRRSGTRRSRVEGRAWRTITLRS